MQEEQYNILNDKTFLYSAIFFLSLLFVLFSFDVYNSVTSQQEPDFNFINYPEPIEKQYVYVPLDCIIKEYPYDVKCYEDFINGDS